MRDLYILGCGRSGTSLVAGTLAGAGYYQGDDLYASRRANPKGFFESPQVNGVNESILARHTPAHPPLADFQRWLAVLTPEQARGVHAMAQERAAIAALVARGPFCFKDPRFTWTLGAWREAAPEAGLVCVFRDPASTVASLLEEAASSEHLAGVELDSARALELWRATYARLLELHAAAQDGGRDWLFLHYDQVLEAAGRKRLAAFAQADLDDDFAEPGLRREPPALELPQDVAELYAKLCERAGHVPGACTTPRPRVAAVLVLGERELSQPRALEQVGRDLAEQRGVAVETLVLDITVGAELASGAQQALDGLRRSLPAPMTVLRAPVLSPAGALARALEATDAPYVTLPEPGARSLPHHYARGVRALEAEPEARVCSTALARIDAHGQHAGCLRGDPGQGTRALGVASLVARRAAFEGLATSAFHPHALERFQALAAEGRSLHLDEPLVEVDDGALASAAEAAQRAAEMIAAAALPAHNGRPKISVAFPCHNRIDALPLTLAALAQQGLAPGSFEVIACDDGSSDGSAEFMAALEAPFPLTYVPGEQRGVAAARNRTLEAASGEYLLFCNDDTLLQPGALAAHLAAHAELGPQACVLGSFEQPASARRNALVRLLEDSTLMFGYPEFEPGEELAPDHFYTCNLSVSAAAVAACGPFDESLHYCEDTDLGYRLDALGWRVFYRPECRSLHHHVVDFDGMRRRQLKCSRVHVQLGRKHPGRVADAFAGATRKRLFDEARKAAGALPQADAAARTLSAVDLGRLEACGGSLAQLAAKLSTQLERVVKPLTVLWWHAGFLQSFQDLGLSGYPELLTETPAHLGDLEPRSVLALHCASGPWEEALADWLASGLGACTLALWTHPDLGPTPEAVAARAAQLRAAALGGACASDAALPELVVVATPMSLSAGLRLRSAVHGFASSGDDSDLVRAVVGLCGALLATRPTRAGAPPEPAPAGDPGCAPAPILQLEESPA